MEPNNKLCDNLPTYDATSSYGQAFDHYSHESQYYSYPADSFGTYAYNYYGYGGQYGYSSQQAEKCISNPCQLLAPTNIELTPQQTSKSSHNQKESSKLSGSTTDDSIKIELSNKDLWDSFDSLQNEMIINKVGRWAHVQLLKNSSQVNY